MLFQTNTLPAYNRWKVMTKLFLIKYVRISPVCKDGVTFLFSEVLQNHYKTLGKSDCAYISILHTMCT